MGVVRRALQMILVASLIGIIHSSGQLSSVAPPDLTARPDSAARVGTPPRPTAGYALLIFSVICVAAAVGLRSVNRQAVETS